MRAKYGSVFLWFILSLTFTSKSLSEEWVFVDIEPKANSKLVGHEWWTGNKGDSTLSRLPMGQIAEFEGPGNKKVKFKIIDGALVLFGTNAAKWPKEIKGIAVGAKAKFIYFLHATGWEQNGVPSYKFVINYDDNKKQELEMISGFNSDDWCHEGAPLQDKKDSVWAWIKKEGPPCGHAGLITTRWENPSPEKKIASIDAISLELASVPVIPAITLGEATLSVAPHQKLATTWATLKLEEMK